MKTSTETVIELSVKKKSKPKINSAKTALTEKIGKYLEKLEHNQIMPFFMCDAKHQQGFAFADIFVGQWNRNAYGGLFIHTDPKEEPLHSKQRKWVLWARHKGYACVVIPTMGKFLEMLEMYRYSAGLSGKQYFNGRWEREL